MDIFSQLSPSGEIETIAGAPFGSEALAIASYAQKAERAVVYVAADERKAQTLQALVSFFAPTVPVLNLPAWDCLPYDRVSPAPAVAARRCSTLAKLARYTGDSALVVVTTSAALIQKCAPQER